MGIKPHSVQHSKRSYFAPQGKTLAMIHCWFELENCVFICVREKAYGHNLMIARISLAAEALFIGPSNSYPESVTSCRQRALARFWCTKRSQHEGKRFISSQD